MAWISNHKIFHVQISTQAKTAQPNNLTLLVDNLISLNLQEV